MEGKLLHPFSSVYGRVPEMFHRRCRQCGVKTDAANPHRSSWHSCRAYGEEHHDEKGNQRAFRAKPCIGKDHAMH